MSLTDHRFRTDHIEIEPCCDKQEKMIQDTPYCLIESSGRYVVPYRWGFIRNTERNKIKCGFCGAKLEYVKKLDGGQ